MRVSVYTTAVCVGAPTAYLLYRAWTAYIRWRKKARILLSLPGDKPHWLYGHIANHPGFNEEGLKFERDIVEKYPRLTHAWYGPVLGSVRVHHPDTVKVILRTSEPKPTGTGAYLFLKPWLGDGLIVSGGSKWNRNRKLLTPAFHFEILRPYIKVKNDAASLLLEIIDSRSNQAESVEIFQLVSHCALDIILRCAFSYDNDCQRRGETHPYVKAVSEMTAAVIERYMHPMMHLNFIFSLTSTGKRFKKNCDYVHQVAQEVITSRRRAMKEGKNQLSSRYLDFLDILLTATDEEGRNLTDLEIRNEVDTFMFAGHDTTSSGISWTLYALASHPEHQEKCQAEIDGVLRGRENDDIQMEDLGKLRYLTMCIKESMRFYPPVIGVQRELTEKLCIDGTEFPPGTMVDVEIYSMHHNPFVWDKPEEFRPERFSPENIDKIDSFGFLPFSAGPRNCIGQNFAMHEMKIVIGRVLRRFKLEIDADRPVRQIAMIIMKTENGMYLKATPRQST